MDGSIWNVLTYLLTRARLRARSALDGHPESGAMTLEWIVIAGILVLAATTAAVFFGSVISRYESKIP
jgi:hypothetical protein